MTEPIRSVEEFLVWTESLKGGMVLYRGLADADWEVESSAYRRMRKPEDDSSVTVPEITFLSYIDHLVNAAGLQGFRERQDRNFSDLELLAELQHYGAATCLIDFTTSALIALWFACRREASKEGKVVAMATDDVDSFSTIRYEDLNKPIKELMSRRRLWKWVPSGLNNRIVAQQSVFVFGERKIEESYYEGIRIDAAYKKDILETLGKSFGTNEQELFNDLAGFALNNAHDQPYDSLSAEEFSSMSIAFQQRGELKQAKEHYDGAIELDSQNPVFYNNRGSTKLALGDFQGAIADLDEAIGLDPLYAAAYNNRGGAKSASGDRQGAIMDFGKAIELDPRDAGFYNNRGVARIGLGDLQGALADYNTAIELDPRNALAYNNRGKTKRELGDHRGAIADYDIAAELSPNFADIYSNRGVARVDLGDFKGAISDCNRAIELNPKYATAYYVRGATKRALGDVQGAIIDLDKAIVFHPRYADAYNERGAAKRELGEFREAIISCDNAIALNPRHAKAYYNRGLAKRALGDEEGAKKDFDMASTIDPSLRPPTS